MARKKQSSAVGHSPAGAKPSITGEKEGVGEQGKKEAKEAAQASNTEATTVGGLVPFLAQDETL